MIPNQNYQQPPVENSIDLSNLNDVFIQAIRSYVPGKSEELTLPEVEEEVLTDEYMAELNLSLQQLDTDMAICREFEGEE